MGLIDLIFPGKCRFCGKKLKKNDRALCPVCRSEYENAKHRVCPGCKRKYLECSCRATVDNKAIARYITLFRYKKNTPGGALILSVKDRKDKAALGLLADDMARSVRRQELAGEDCAVTYVPRSKKAERDTGVDQSQELAKRIAKSLGLPFVAALKRGKSGKAQKTLSAEERKERVEDLYAASSRISEISGKRVILVDDVRTTGATLAACAEVLFENGAREIIALTAGKA